MKPRIGVVCGLVGALALVGAYWWLESSTRPAEGAAPGETATLPVRATGSAPVASLEVKSEGTSAEADGSSSRPEGVEGNNTATTTAGDILAEPDEDYVRVAKKLLALALNSRAPMVEREEALAHALNLSAGNEAEVLTPAIKNPDLPDAFAETILAEALNRSLAYQADLYLVALETRKSPELQTMIREHLAFLTGGEDKGSNPADWRDAIKAAKASWPE